MQVIISIAIGGAIGAILRFLFSRYIANNNATTFPLGTYIVNMIGSFLIGFLYTIFDKITVRPEIRSFLLIGLIGAFTTFSTFILESFNLFKDNEILLGFLNILFSQIGGFLSLFLGIILVRILLLGKF